MAIRRPQLRLCDKATENGEATLTLPPQNSSEPWGDDIRFDVIGHACSRPDGPDKVTGRARYSSDVQLPGQLCAGVLRSPHPHALIARIDTSAAQQLSGVHGVLTHRDELDLVWYDEEVPLFDNIVRFVGDEVAAVIADSDDLVEDALRAIKVEYEPLPFVVDMLKALADDAPHVHPGGNLVEEPKVYERGAARTAFENSEVQVDAVYSTQTAVHNALESHTTVAHWVGDELTLYESTQGVFAVRDDMAEKLGLAKNQVRVVTPHMGGGFGAKQIPWKQTAIAAMLAKRCGRPVRLMLDRRAENLAVGNRSQTRQHVRLGAARDGTLQAIWMDATITRGAYCTDGEASSVDGIYQHLYRCSDVATKLVSVYTHLGPSVAFRAPGYVEGAFGLESAMDELAAKLGIDPLELRLRNYAERDQRKDLPWSSPQALRQCYQRVDRIFGWRARVRPRPSRGKRRGMGFAAHEWLAGTGSPPAYALVLLNCDASVELFTGTQDIGTGTRTVLAQVAAEVLGLPIEHVRVRLGDTQAGLYSPASAGSFTTPTLVPAVRAAAENAREQLLQAASVRLGIDEAHLQCKHGEIASDRGSSIGIADLLKQLSPHTVQGHGSYLTKPDGTSIRTFGAACAEVEVDIDSGEVTLVRIVLAPDCGRIVNPKLARSQVIGGVTQGIGFALTEERIVDTALGVVLNPNLEDYEIATALDVANISHAEVDLPDLNANPSGTKGLGELPLIPTAPAILNAIYDAVGVRLRELPANRRRMLQALAQRKPS